MKKKRIEVESAVRGLLPFLPRHTTEAHMNHPPRVWCLCLPVQLSYSAK